MLLQSVLKQHYNMLFELKDETTFFSMLFEPWY
jgi:hypothetical protein